MRDEKGRFIKGQISLRKGVVISEETRRKMSLARLGKSPWNKGMKNKYRTSKKGYKMSEQSKKKISAFQQGKSLKEWTGYKSSQNKIERLRFQHSIQKLVFERDNYTCQICGIKNIDLQVDHIQPWKDYVELRFKMENCRTLCAKCHYEITFKKPMPKSVKTWGHNLLRRVEK